MSPASATPLPLASTTGPAISSRVTAGPVGSWVVSLSVSVTTGPVGGVPLAVAGAIPGHEIEHPMAIVILGGLATATLLNLFVLPSLYLRFGKPPAR